MKLFQHLRRFYSTEVKTRVIDHLNKNSAVYSTFSIGGTAVIGSLSYYINNQIKPLQVELTSIRKDTSEIKNEMIQLETRANKKSDEIKTGTDKKLDEIKNEMIQLETRADKKSDEIKTGMIQMEARTDKKLDELKTSMNQMEARTDKKIDELKDLVMSLILQNNISKQISDSTKKSSD